MVKYKGIICLKKFLSFSIFRAIAPFFERVWAANCRNVLFPTSIWPSLLLETKVNGTAFSFFLCDSAPPRFAERSARVSARKGAQVVLECDVFAGDRPINVFWRKNGIPLGEDQAETVVGFRSRYDSF